MSTSSQATAATESLGAIDDVCSRIEDSFARVGEQLGRGHAIFKDLNQGLGALSQELSGTSIEDATAALQEIARRLTALADGLPAENNLLGNIGRGAAEAASLLKPLFKHIQMITIIARSARIEAASLEKDRESFVDFTREALELGENVKQSIEQCARDQLQLADAVAAALAELANFDRLYHAQLVAVAGELTSAHTGMIGQRGKSVTLTERAGASTKLIADAVARAIVSLQSGDSVRQRLEHIRHGLALAAGHNPSIVPAPAGALAPDMAALVCRLEAAQLNDTHGEFGRDIGQIVHALNMIVTDATGVVAHGRSLYGGADDEASFLAVIRQALGQASSLIATCEKAGRSVDGALEVVNDTLHRFREAIEALPGVVIDIILIGMNASLKAGHIGAKGNAFVVIANELKATADQVSVAAAKLAPVLDGIEHTAGELKALRGNNPATLGELEPRVLRAITEVEHGSGRLVQLMARLETESGEFERLIGSGREIMTALAEACRKLPAVASKLDQEGRATQVTKLSAANEATFADLFARYTMEREREVHAAFLAPFGVVAPVAAPAAGADEDDGVLLF